MQCGDGPAEAIEDTGECKYPVSASMEDTIRAMRMRLRLTPSVQSSNLSVFDGVGAADACG